MRSTHDFDEIVGQSRAIRLVLARVSQVAPTDAAVLLLGETGTGKELVARAIHQRSARSARAFVAINCAAIPETLIESELFGHEKGAFTGAVAAADRAASRSADGGTLFLDEIGELGRSTCRPSSCACCRTGRSSASGSTRTLHVDVRVIAATNRDLDAPWPSGPLPRGSLLPAQRIPHHAAAAARAPRGHPAAGVVA